MKIEINKLIQEESTPFKFTIRNDDLHDLEGKLDEDGGLVEGSIVKLSKYEFFIQFAVKATMIFPCARCLEASPVLIHYDYADTVSIDDEAELDLLPLVDDLIYIYEPFRILCQNDCRGLCPKCGTDLNHEQCSCEHEGEIDPRFEVLKDLL